jgi:hypothetical protein
MRRKEGRGSTSGDRGEGTGRTVALRQKGSEIKKSIHTACVTKKPKPQRYVHACA